MSIDRRRDFEEEVASALDRTCLDPVRHFAKRGSTA
jgi:hypothetical protein